MTVNLGLQRPAEGRIIGGVCAAIAERTGMHVMLIRLAALLLSLASGVGVVLYVGLWLVIPSHGGQGSMGRFQLGQRELAGFVGRIAQATGAAWSRRGATEWPRPLGRFWLGAALVSVGVVIFLRAVGLFAWLGLGATVGLLALLGGVAILLSLASEEQQ